MQHVIPRLAFFASKFAFCNLGHRAAALLSISLGIVASLQIMSPDRLLSCSTALSELRLVDKEVRYGTKQYSADDKPRPAPVLVGAPLPVASVPEKIKSPGGWEENAYTGPGEQSVFKSPHHDRLLQLIESTRGIDDTNTGAMDYKLWYRISRDGGKSYSELKPLIQKGDGYDYRHPIAGVWVGTNSFVFGGPIVGAYNGEILVPTYRWPLDADRKRLNPHGAYTYMESGVLIGKWTEDGSDVEWDSGQFVRPEAEQSTRGSDESTIAELKTPGHFLMVARGSNQNKPDFPGRKWFSISKDYCRTWTKPIPWTYTNGEPFFSPAAQSTLIRSSKNNRLYWIGNISPKNPEANYPRFPLVMGEIVEASGLLIQASILTIDDRNPEHDSEKMQLSNFRTTEDPKTGNILITLTRLDDEKLPPKDDPKTWYQGPPNWYLIEVPGTDP